MRRMDAEAGEIKRMFVRPADPLSWRGRRVLGRSRTRRALGYRRVRLDTGPRQVHAINLYRRAGYAPVDPYNDNPFASFWGEKGADPAQCVGATRLSPGGRRSRL